MSKAFTKEDDGSGFSPPSSSALALPAGTLKLTARGAKILSTSTDERVRAALSRSEILGVQSSPERAAVGVTVRVRDESGERAYRLVMPEEQALLGEGCSIQSPIGRALLGARIGDVREVRTPRGATELEVLALEGEE